MAFGSEAALEARGDRVLGLSQQQAMTEISDHGGKPVDNRPDFMTRKRPDWVWAEPPKLGGAIIIRSSAATDKGG